MKLITRHPDLGTLLPIYLEPNDGNPPAGGGAPASPEDRLAVLEHAVKAKDAEIATARTEASGLRAELVAEAAKTKSLQEQVGALRKEADQAFLEGVRKQSAACQAPIEEKHLARIGELLAAGNRDQARELAELHLELAKARSSRPAPEGAFVRVAPPPPTEADRKNSASREAAILRDRGWDVELSQDGTTVIRATPPGKGK